MPYVYIPCDVLWENSAIVCERTRLNSPFDLNSPSLVYIEPLHIVPSVIHLGASSIFLGYNQTIIISESKFCKKRHMLLLESVCAYTLPAQEINSTKHTCKGSLISNFMKAYFENIMMQWATERMVSKLTFDLVYNIYTPGNITVATITGENRCILYNFEIQSCLSRDTICWKKLPHCDFLKFVEVDFILCQPVTISVCYDSFTYEYFGECLLLFPIERPIRQIEYVCPRGFKPATLILEDTWKQLPEMTKLENIKTFLYSILNWYGEETVIYQDDGQNNCWQMTPLFNSELSDWNIVSVRCDNISHNIFICEEPPPLVSYQNYGCNISQYQCLDTSCILMHYRCDGIIDCPSHGDDEQECNEFNFDTGIGYSFNSTFEKDHNASCQFHFMQCPDGNCIPVTDVCNGSTECSDGFDETICNYFIDNKNKI